MLIVNFSSNIAILCRFFEYLQFSHIQYVVYLPYFEEIHTRFPNTLLIANITTFQFKEELYDCKFIYSFGGDGTVLECVRILGLLSKPILGVNFGRLGYLTSITQNELISATEELCRDMYRIDERQMLSVVSDPPGIFGNENFGLNDITIHKSHTNEMIRVHTYVNGEFLNSYWGDGLVIATPTGSTAYSLACGGPIIFPTAETFIITPIAPHSLTVRPVVIPNNSVIACEVESRSGQAMLALDTRTEIVRQGTAIAIKRATWTVKLVRMYQTKYIGTLRRTLMWGSDSRK